MASTLRRKSPPPTRTAPPPTMPDLLRLFLSYSGRWNDSDKELASRILERAPADPLAAWRADPARILTAAGLAPDPWQVALMRSSSARILMLACRQVGKSLVAAGLALREALLRPSALVLLLSVTQRQAGELFRDKVMFLYEALGRPIPAVRETALTLELANGSRIISLPSNEAGVRVYAAVRMLVVDEAARVPDALYQAVRPMLAVSRGKLVLSSSAYAQMGFFFTEWTEGGPEWERVKILATECPRISAKFLEEERRTLGERIFAREYLGEFSATDDAYFDFDSIRRALASANDEPPLFWVTRWPYRLNKTPFYSATPCRPRRRAKTTSSASTWGRRWTLESVP
jgi:hypothetical protein